MLYVENLSDHRNGVGEEENSLALDCCRGGECSGTITVFSTSVLILQ
jgi:hypothetical protein